MAHVLVYPDGMRRYGKERSISLDVSYSLGAAKLQRAAQWLFLDLGFQEVTFHCFAIYNRDRPLDELQPLVNNGITTLVALMDSEWMRRNNISLRVVGALDQLSERFPDVGKIAAFSNQHRYRHDGRILNILAAYAGWWDLEQAIACCGSAGRPIVFQNIQHFMRLQRPIDLIVRSGQMFRQIRLSDTLLRADQAQMFGFPTLWPDVRKQQFARIKSHWQVLNENRLGV